MMRVLKRAARPAFTFAGAHTDPDAPLHLALAGQSIPLSSWRRRRVQLLATNKHASAVMPTLPLGGPGEG